MKKSLKHRYSARNCSHCDKPMTVQKKRDRGKGFNLCGVCMTDPKVYPRCKGVNRIGNACRSIALYQYDEATNTGFCTHHKDVDWRE